MDFDFDAAARLPPNIHFGTSSWKYPGWKGQVYLRDYGSKRQFEKQCLQEYAEFPWFSSVGLDSTYYRPPNRDYLSLMAANVSPKFKWLPKVWDQITIDIYPRGLKYGEKSGRENENFLNPAVFRELFLAPFVAEDVRRHTGPFIFQFQPMWRTDSLSRDRFLDRLDAFFAGLPTNFRYAVELRNPEMLTPRYFGILNEYGATHCFNHWGGMPPLVVQMRAAAAAGGLQANWYVARLLTPLGLGYKQSVERFSPYERLGQVQPQMRSDVLRLARRALDRGAEAWILVNNRIEGNAPQTIDALGRAIVAGL